MVIVNLNYCFYGKNIEEKTLKEEGNINDNKEESTIIKEVNINTPREESIIKEEDITEEYFSTKLYNQLPDVDYVIRTSGEQRISNFLLWEISYAEFCFTPDYFPDFDEEKFDEVIKEYYNRDRRFGNAKK